MLEVAMMSIAQLLTLVSLFKIAQSVSVDEVRAMANKPYQPTLLSFSARSFGKMVFFVSFLPSILV